MTVDDAARLEAPVDAAASPTVLVVDDEPALVELYSERSTPDHTVRAMTDGTDALEVVDTAFDVILLDRRMPGMDVDAVLTELRDRGTDEMVAMVTAVEPDPFDEYVIKPMSREAVTRTVERLVHRGQYSSHARRCFELASTLSVLESSQQGTDDREPIRSLRKRLNEDLSAADETIRRRIESGGIEGAPIDLDR